MASIIDPQTLKHSFITPHRQLLTVDANHLIGSNFEGTNKENNYWTETASGSGNTIQGSGVIELNTGLTANSSIKYQTKRVSTYQAGSSNYYSGLCLTSDLGTVNNIRRWGAYDTNNGYFFELNGTNFYFVTRSNGKDTKYISTSWDIPYIYDDNFHTYDINYRSLTIDIYVDNILKSIIKLKKDVFSSALSLPVTLENINSNNGTSNVSLNCAASYIKRMGGISCVPNYIFQTGIASTIIKKSSGNLDTLIIGAVSDKARVILYDNLAASGTVLWNSGEHAVNAQTNNFPYALDFKNVAFTNGLTIQVASGNCNVLVLYN